MEISVNPTRWLMVDFEPDTTRQYVIANADGDGPDRASTFKDVQGVEYKWIGELKPEFAQSIAQAIAARTSRIPLNKSEWLRRSEGG